MKPFNLEEAKLGKEVCLGNGGKAEIIAFNDKYRNTGYYDTDSINTVIASVKYKNGTLLMCFNDDGLNVIDELRKYDFNLSMV